ncbi:LecA/PA-IL family lectin [Xenorhabdus stockiae]|uniref:LecA/PA-IL family lectin n=1 Tax=Xenorhabdus stockiae TaxID=351614 RepID=UPI004064A1E2
MVPDVSPDNPEQFFLVAKIGNNFYKIGNGVLHKEIPNEGGKLKFIFLSATSYYENNSGQFEISVVKEN